MSATTAPEPVYLEDIELPVEKLHNTPTPTPSPPKSSLTSASGASQKEKEDSKEGIYLEDLPLSQKTSKKAPLTVATNTGKRQRTLLDMHFAPGPDAAAAKRQKTTGGVAMAARFTATKPGATFGSSSSSRLKLTTTQPLNAIPFSLSAFTAALPSDEARALLALECHTLGKSWLKLLAPELSQPYFLKLKQFLWAEGVKGPADDIPRGVYPKPCDIYAWSHTPLGRVKVVILGQDPYPGAGQAHGLSFSVPRGVGVPGSLQNIFTQLRTEYPDFVPPPHGNLAGWTAQGVLLLNTVLTVRAGAPASHAEHGWEAFTETVLRVVDAYGGANLPAKDGDASKKGVGRGVVVLAWGAKAAKRVANLDRSKHLILTSAHPSPKSAANGFFGNGHFTAANRWLEERYGPGTGVEWGKL
ncbi:uracil-DNA glycosylase-like protein [Mycena crocata]|nr:uracil-DNA glycosylase-like protein [Mycena crocata]